jgi:UDP-N-acetylmuramyl pentapeptide phosphotransferase/UDP-N-acetylglucosamine-1-phosphate transferase
MIALTNTIAIAIAITIAIAIAITITITIITISPGRNVHTTHTPTLGGKRAADSIGESESEICSRQYPIVYRSCSI